MSPFDFHNDYISIVKEYLRGYNRYKVTVDLLQENIKKKEFELGLSVSAPISKYGNSMSGEYSELNSVEKSVDKNNKMLQKIAIAQRDIRSITRMLNMVDKAVAALDERKQTAIKEFYFNKKTWIEVGNDMYVSEKTARDIGRIAVKEIASMMYGSVSDGENFIFI